MNKKIKPFGYPNVMLALDAKWNTVRGVAKWARRNIGWHKGTLSNGETFRVSGHYDNSYRSDFERAVNL